MAKRGLPKGTKFLQLKNFRISQKRWNKFLELADKSNAMLDELQGMDLFGIIKKDDSKFSSIKEFNIVLKRLEKRTKFSTKEYKLYRERIFQKNYIAGLYDVYGERKNIDEIASIVDNLDADEFYKMYKEHKLPEIYSFYNKYDYSEYWSIIKEQIRTASAFE